MSMTLLRTCSLRKVATKNIVSEFRVTIFSVEPLLKVTPKKGQPLDMVCVPKNSKIHTPLAFMLNKEDNLFTKD